MPGNLCQSCQRRHVTGRNKLCPTCLRARRQRQLAASALYDDDEVMHLVHSIRVTRTAYPDAARRNRLELLRLVAMMAD